MERDIIWRHRIQPGLNMVVEDSLNILLEITTPDGSEVIARSDALSDAASVDTAVTLARVFVARTEDENQRQRYAAVRERTARQLRPRG